MREFYGSVFGWEFVEEANGAAILTPNVPGEIHPGDEGASPYLFFRVCKDDQGSSFGLHAQPRRH